MSIEPDDKLPRRFDLSSIADLQQRCAQLGVRIPIQDDLTILAQPVQVGPMVVPNSLAVHPMEGCDGNADGSPAELTIRRYDRFAAGGAGLLWVEAIAVVPEGRANPRQLWLHEESMPQFASLVDRIRAHAASARGSKHRPVLVAQLTHSGRYSRPTAKPQPLVAQKNPHRDKMLPADTECAVVTDDYLDRLKDSYVKAAKLAFAAGFDTVDIKACHGYLINDLLAGHTREGQYGGSFENRTRFLLDVIDRIHAELGQDKMVVTRLGVYDAIPYPYGWGVDRDDPTQPDLTEPTKLMGLLAGRGVKMVNITVANPYYNPHFGRPYDKPIIGGYPSPEHPLVGVARLIDVCGKLQQAHKDMALLGTGYTWLRTLVPQVAAGVKSAGLASLIGLGRLAFAYPDFAADILDHGRLDNAKVCIACSACSQMMRDGVMAGCLVRDTEIYGPIYKQGRQH